MARTSRRYAVGVDFGTNSVRALVVDVADGSEVATHVYQYPTGDEGVMLDPADPHLARQHPGDYIKGFVASVRGAVRGAHAERGVDPANVIGIGIDATGSTPLPVDTDGIALALHPEFKHNLAAQAWLWKDHTSHAEAAEITERAARSRQRYTAKCGGAYSSEWYWSKVLHCKRVAPNVFHAAHSWVELADFVPAYVTGNTRPETLPRGICAAGHKALFHEDWGGLPPRRFLASLDPDLPKVRDHYARHAKTSDQAAGGLTPSLAKQVGLPANTPVAVGAIDAHMGAVGAGVQPGTLVKIMGTSTCDITVWPASEPLADIPGLCGIVPGSVIADMYGLEAGQSAVGDIFNWFVRQFASTSGKTDPHVMLSEQASQLKPGESGLLALDWNNGNRTILVDPRLSGLLVGHSLHTTPAEVYRALIEATAFGALKIIQQFETHGVKIKQVVNCGGIAEKNALVMQIYADVCNRPMKLSRSAQTCALGAAIFGAVAGGGYKSVTAAQKRMSGVKSQVFKPNPASAKIYRELFALYDQLHDAFGMKGPAAAHHNVMKDLLALRERVRKG